MGYSQNLISFESDYCCKQYFVKIIFTLNKFFYRNASIIYKNLYCCTQSFNVEKYIKNSKNTDKKDPY